MRTDTIAFRDSIKAALRDAWPEALTTREVAERAGGYLDFRPNNHNPAYPCDDERREQRKRDGWAYILWCDGVNHTYVMPPGCGNRHYQELARMFKRGEIQKIKDPSMNSVMWVAFGADLVEREKVGVMLEEVWSL